MYEFVKKKRTFFWILQSHKNMLNLDSPQSFLETAFNYVNLNWKDYVSTSKEFYRPTRTSSLKGDSTKALNILKFKPSYGFEDLVIEMVEHDLADLKKRS